MQRGHQPWSIKVLTLFPEIFPGPLGVSVIGKALNSGIWTMEVKNIRDYAVDKHGSVDDTPYGGGGGMILRVDVISNAMDDFFSNENPIIYFSPRGEVFNQEIARAVSRQCSGINLICGRFEGIDERVFEKYQITEISIGDYVLSSGDLAAYVFLDACLRNIPGVLQDEERLSEESFGDSEKYQYLLEYPHYTKPAIWNDSQVPDVLLSGHHQKIAEWRLKQAETITRKYRKDLWEKYAKKCKKQ